MNLTEAAEHLNDGKNHQGIIINGQEPPFPVFISLAPKDSSVSHEDLAAMLVQKHLRFAMTDDFRFDNILGIECVVDKSDGRLKWSRGASTVPPGTVDHFFDAVEARGIELF